MGLLTYASHHVRVERRGLAEAVDHVYELARDEQTLERADAGQGFDVPQLPALEVDHRLEVHLDLPSRERLGDAGESRVTVAKQAERLLRLLGGAQDETLLRAASQGEGFVQRPLDVVRRPGGRRCELHRGDDGAQRHARAAGRQGDRRSHVTQPARDGRERVP